MFSHHEAGIFTIRQLKIIEVVKKLVHAMKTLYNATWREEIVEKQTKLLKTRRKILSLLTAQFPVRVAGAAGRLSYHTSQFSITPYILLGWSPEQFHLRSSM